MAAPGHSAGGAALTVVSTSNWPVDTGVIFAMDQVTTQVVNGVSTQVRVPGTYTEWEGVVTSGTAIGSLVLREGTDQDYPAGSSTRVYIPVSSSRENRTVDGLSVSLDQDGTLKAGAVDNSGVLANGVVTTAKMPNAAVTADKIFLGPQTASVAANETTGSATYGDLGTTTDSVTVTIGANGLALVIISATFNNSGANQTYASFAASGANTIAADDSHALEQGATSQNFGMGRSVLLTGLTPGATTFKMKYRVTGGTGAFFNRNISVVPL